MRIGLYSLTVEYEVVHRTACRDTFDRDILVVARLDLDFGLQARCGNRAAGSCGGGLDLYEGSVNRKRCAGSDIDGYTRCGAGGKEKGKAGTAPRNQLDVAFGLEFGYSCLFFQEKLP